MRRARLFLAIILACSRAAVLSAQSERTDTLQFDRASLSDLATAIGQVSGRTITAAPYLSDRRISGRIAAAKWRDGLDRLLDSQGLILRPDSASSLRIEPQWQITIDYAEIPLSQFASLIGEFVNRKITLAPGVPDVTVTYAALSQDWQRALEAVTQELGFALTPDVNGDFSVRRR